jgi:hypothetical protein
MAYGMFEPSMLSYGDGAAAWSPTQKVPAMSKSARAQLPVSGVKQRMAQIDSRIKYLRKAYTISDWWKLTVIGAVLDRLKEPYKSEVKKMIAERKELKAQLKSMKKYTKAEEKLAADVADDPFAAGVDPMLDAGLVAGGGLPAGAETVSLVPGGTDTFGSLSMGAKIGIGVGVLALVGGIAWFALAPAKK